MVKDSLPKLLSLNEACEILDVHPNTLRNWDKKGILKAIRFGQRKDRHYSREDILKLVNNTEKAAVQNSESEDSIGEEMRAAKAEEAISRLSSLQLITSLLSKSLNKNEVVKIIVSQCLSSVGANKCLLLELSENQKKAIVLGSSSYSVKELHKWSRYGLTPLSPVKNVVESKEPVFIESPDELKVLYPSLRNSGLITDNWSLALLPLMVERRLLAILILSFNHAFRFSKNNSTFLLSLANQFAMSLERSNLYEKEISAKQMAEETEEMLESIYQSSMKILSTIDSRQTYQIVLNEALNIVGAPYGSIFLKTGGQIKRIYTNVPKLYSLIPRKNGRLGQFLANKKPAVGIIHEKTEIHQELKDLGVKSVVHIPLSYENETVGVINILSLKQESIPPRKFNALKIFGAITTLAIIRNNLYSEAKTSLDERDLFISIASHELKNPLSTIYGYTQLIDAEVSNHKLPNRAWIKQMSSELTRSLNLINELLHVDSIGTGKLQFYFKKNSLKKIIKNAIDNFSLTHPGFIVVFKKPENFVDAVRVDSDKMTQAIINLLSNAAKFSPKGSSITVFLKKDKKDFVISVQDQGQGINGHDVDKVFEKFYRGNGQNKNGMGLGLYLVRDIIKNHHGKIDIESKVNVGTTVSIHLPT